jgi:hypothetical protein
VKRQPYRTLVLAALSSVLWAGSAGSQDNSALREAWNKGYAKGVADCQGGTSGIQVPALTGPIVIGKKQIDGWVQDLQTGTISKDQLVDRIWASVDALERNPVRASQ